MLIYLCILNVIFCFIYSPIFGYTHYKYIVVENHWQFELEVPISAADIDHDDNNRAIRYKIVSGNSGSWLKINSETGQIEIEKPFDFEGIPSPQINSSGVATKEINFTIEAHDLGTPQQSSFVNLTVLIMDENDCAPEFTTNHYEFAIREDSPEGTAILTVSAVDRDATLIFNHIIYGMKEHAPNFKIDEKTGVISLTSMPLDYFVKQDYLLHVVAKNEDGL